MFHAPAHHMGFWGVKLRRLAQEKVAKGLVCDAPASESALVSVIDVEHGAIMLAEFSGTLFATSELQDRPAASGQQIGFDFGL